MKIGTHNGKFHTDEVCAIALLLRVYPEAEVVRTRDAKVLETCDIVVDVGEIHDRSSGRFDHHQKGGAGEWPNGTKLSSFGLVWDVYGFKLSPLYEVHDAIEEMLVIPVDARDNGQQPERRPRDIPSLADVIDSFSLAWNETGDENAAFMEAVRFISRYLERLIVRCEAQRAATDTVREAVANRRGRLIILEQGLPWQEVIITESLDTHFVVLPGNNGEWLVQAVPEKIGTQQPLRKRLPLEWAGLSGQALTDETGVPDAKFCHNNGFIAVASSLAGAL